ncbi:MAG TPA: hypothetical protein VGH35_11740 [Gaiellaceae bacterium]
MLAGCADRQGPARERALAHDEHLHREDAASITLAAAQARIDIGGSVKPAKLVSGRKERDVLAYLATIVAAK